MVWIALLLLCALQPWTAAAMRADYLAQLRQETVDTFYHGFSNYMKHAFPEDELRPLTCSSLTRDRDNPGRIELNDALGNYSLTLIDSLSTLAILAGGPQDGRYTGPQALSDFQDGVAEFVRYYGDGRTGPSGAGVRARGFDLDSKVQVFETVIRGVGGLLSAHLFAIGELPIPGYEAKPLDGFPTDDPLELPPIPWPNGFKYDGQLLRLALDLSQRLLPAFYTTTGIPYPRVNLRSGIPFYVNSPLNQASADTAEPEGRPEITETCSAGAGSLTLEFTVLSRLTGDPRFEQAAKRAFWEVWRRRSEIGLIGNGIDAERGLWIGPHSGIGAGMDSFFEYALKSHILLSGQGMPNASTSRRHSTTDWLDPASLHGPLPPQMHSADAFLEAWHQAHASVKRHIYTDRSQYPYYSNSHRATGQPYTMWIDSLGAFYPGLLALAGEVEEAIEANLVYTALWTRYSALPERWSIRENNVEAGIGWWPGRPEFIESTYHIYRATQDPWYLHVGEMVLKDIRQRCYAPCGWAGLQDVRTGEQQDRMESFFLGETTKYMYLLFDPSHPLNNLDAAYVFTTEGHPLIIPKKKNSRPQKAPRGNRKDVSTYSYYDEAFTNSCPAPAKPDSLSGSITAARPHLFDASRFTDLHNTPNLHGPLEMVQIEDKKKGRIIQRRALSNHTLFPWTLPPSLLPQNGTCAAPIPRVISAIEFPASDAASSLMSKFGASLVWYNYAGPTVKNLEGLRLQLEREPGDDPGGDNVWRITHVGSTQLGRHETVFFHAEHVSHLKDEAFTCRRRRDSVEIELLVDVPPQQNATMPIVADSTAPPTQSASDDDAHDDLIPIPSESLLKHLLRAVSSVFEPSHTDAPSADEPSAAATILSFFGHTAVGAGAHPVPALAADTPILGSPGYDTTDPAANFPWTTIYLAGHACDGPLPDAAPREHQLIVMRRGGCSFSHKLDNIPSFSPAHAALQLVVIVDEGDEGSRLDAGVDRPLLTSEQRTPKGMKRVHGVPLVLVGGERGDYERFGEAVAAGMRRRYRIESQGLVIANAVVI
ncbi:ER glycosyl hydrolase (Edem) [Purpureocillium lilacinum]|uniref:alpha-1,2-Mannosidase n=1 Tax=Purpureocillium lilacinum TaxID=33203 RepID=A0A179GN61_PURLI|nr:ER glycosyl hydrolase (Edem) [Purpureocillium lilacinum]OAQ79346.1 ER glycosyl hydrolase (Edem) [Purpureocillium lilacinum]